MFQVVVALNNILQVSNARKMRAPRVFCAFILIILMSIFGFLFKLGSFSNYIRPPFKAHSATYLHVQNAHSHFGALKKGISTPNNHLSTFYKTWNDNTSSRTGDRLMPMKIVIWTTFFGRNYSSKLLACPSLRKSCTLTTDRQQVAEADAVVFHFWDTPKIYNRSAMPSVRLPHQYWVWYAKECPENNRNVDLTSYSGVYNWTMTYRNDSDIPGPLGSLYQIYNILKGKGLKENSTEKSGLVVWFVSKCYKYFPRHIYATELSRYIPIDVFGGCGRRICPRANNTCKDNIVSQYKFYLAFESYSCKEYITEKFWHNALKNGVVPIVIGPPKSDYEKFTPANSFIHVDDFESPEALASYIKMLDRNDDKYNQYFSWRTNRPKLIPEILGQWCLLCTKLINTSSAEKKVYTDLERWWKGENYEFCKPLVLTDNIFDVNYRTHYNTNSSVLQTL
ncbi:alpha-(1,3)-fucosyltransferase 7-like [Branchiostoma floridae x Branchiostoma belcheri]